MLPFSCSHLPAMDFPASHLDTWMYIHIWRFPFKGGTNGWFIMENTIQKDENWGVPLFQETTTFPYIPLTKYDLNIYSINFNPIYSNFQP